MKMAVKNRRKEAAVPILQKNTKDVFGSAK